MSPLWVAEMPLQASPTPIILHSLSAHWCPFYFSVWSLAGHLRVFWASWLFSVVYECPKNRKLGSPPAVSCAVNSQQLCGIFKQKHWSPVLHLHPRLLKSIPPSMANNSLSCKPNIFIPLICHSITNSPSNCTPQAPLFYPLQPSLPLCLPNSAMHKSSNY